MEKWQNEMDNFLDSDKLSKGSYLHAVIDGLCALIEKFKELVETKRKTRYLNSSFVQLNSEVTVPLFSSTPVRNASTLSLNNKSSSANRFNFTQHNAVSSFSTQLNASLNFCRQNETFNINWDEDMQITKIRKKMECLTKKLDLIRCMLTVAKEASFHVDSRSLVYCISVLSSSTNPNKSYF